MTKTKKSILKKSLLALLSIIVLVVAFGFWFISLLPVGSRSGIETTQPQQLAYLSQNIVPQRGKILAVVTSTDKMGNSGKTTGYELTELSRAYYVFKANGFEVDIASPLGGKPPVIIDQDDMGLFDYAFLNDSVAQFKVQHSVQIDKINPADYDAVFFAGGKGAMFDFPENAKIQAIVKDYYQSGKVIGAVCHGPAALVNVRLENGTSLLQNKTISSFTNEEELFLIPDAKTIFPFLLQSKLEAQGAQFSAGHLYLEKVSIDENLVTGQNPWSTWAMAEAMIAQLGYTPKEREISPEENTIHVLATYESSGFKEAKISLKSIMDRDFEALDRTLLAVHGMVAGMDWDIRKTYDMIRLVAYAKDLADE